MPKRRETKASIHDENKDSDLEEKIRKFGDGADKLPIDIDPKAPRNYKAIRVPFNEYEFNKLEAIAKQADRSKLYVIRQAILNMAKQHEE